MWFGARPALARLRLAAAGQDESRSRGLLAGILVFVFVSALATESIGIHALFGAFLAGVVLPDDSELRRFLKERLETFSTAVLLPLFFAFTGLRTEIGLVGGVAAWLVTLGLIAVAVAGKLGASTLAARWTGLSWPDAAAVGSLMNTRGLVELIVLNLGLDLGILSPRIFAMLVVMALVTTMMTGPLLSAIDRWRGRQAPASP
jgi:Kef-type K+ transport system membrane component KefB